MSYCLVVGSKGVEVWSEAVRSVGCGRRQSVGVGLGAVDGEVAGFVPWGVGVVGWGGRGELGVEGEGEGRLFTPAVKDWPQSQFNRMIKLDKFENIVA